MASLPSIQSTGACRSTPGRPGGFLQSSCSHRVTPFTSRTRKWTKRTHIKQCVPWSTCSVRRTSSVMYAAAVDEPQPEEAPAEEAEILPEDENEADALLEDDEFKPHAVYELTEEQIQDRATWLSTLAKSTETKAQQLTAQEEEDEQISRDVAGTVVEAALELEQKFGGLRAVAGGSKESPLPFSDDAFWQEVEEDVETIEWVENFDDTKATQNDPFAQYILSSLPPKSLNDDDAFHSDPEIVALREAQVEGDVVEYTDEEKAVLAALEGEALEEDEDDASPVLESLTSLLGVPEAATEDEKLAAQEAAAGPAADVNELLQDKEFGNIVDIAALTAGLTELPEEQANGVKWLANKFSKAASETTYSEVVANALEGVQAASAAGELQTADVESFKALLQQVSESIGDASGSQVDLGEGFSKAVNDTLAAISKDGFVEPVSFADESAVEAFFAEHKDTLADLEAMESAFNQLTLPDAKTAREQSEDLLLQLVSELDDPELTTAALASEISVADAAAAKDYFLSEAKSVLGEAEYKQVQAYFQSAFLAKVQNSGEPGDAEPEVPDFALPEVKGLDVGDEEADNVQPDLSKIPAEVDDADDYELDDFDEDVVKWRHVKADLLSKLLEDGVEDEEAVKAAVSALQPEDAASVASLKTLMQLVQDAATGRPLLKDFKLDDGEVDDDVTFPTLEATIAEIKKGGDAAPSVTDSPVLQQLVPLLQAAANEKSLETPAFEVQVPEVPELEDTELELSNLDDPLEDFATPVINEAAAAADLQERTKIREQYEADLNGVDLEAGDDEFEADEQEKALLAQVADVDPEAAVKEWVEGEGFLELGSPEVDLEGALAKAEAAAKAFSESTAEVEDPSGLSDEDYANLKIAFDNLYLVKAATSPEAQQLKEASEKIRSELLAHRFANTIGEFVESTVTRGHLDDLNLLKIDEAAFAGLNDDDADQAISDLVDKVSAFAEDKLVAAAEEAVKDLDDLNLPVEADAVIPSDISEQFEADILEKIGAERLGELKAEAEIQSILENPRSLGLDIDPVELTKGEYDPEDPLYELKLLEENGVVAPVAEETEEDAPVEAAAEEEEGEEDAVVAEASEEPVLPPTPEGTLLAELVDQVIDNLQKVDEDDLYFDDEVYDAEADTEAAAEQAEAEVDEDEYTEDGLDDEVEAALDLPAADEDEDEELSGLVYTDSAARSGAVEDEAEDDLEEYGEEEGEGDVAPEDMRNEYNSFLSEELFGNPTFADIWEEMGIPEMRPKEPVKMDQEDYDPNAVSAQAEDKDEDEDDVKVQALDEEGEEDVQDVPIGNWFGDDDDSGDLAADDAEDVDEETSLEKLSKYYGGRAQSWEGLDENDAPRAELDVFSGATYLDGGDDDDRAADDVTGLMERATVTKDGVVFIERVIQVQRVTKVVKGGNIMSFRCTAVVGNRAGIVGVGIGSAREVAKAVQKAVADAKKNVIMVPLTKYASIPHRVEKKFKASQCVINPAADGTGCIAGGAIRSVLELAGVKNCLAKQLGTRNPMNNAKLTIEALKDLQTWGEVAAKRNVSIEYLFAQNQDEAEKALKEHRSGLEEELF